MDKLGRRERDPVELLMAIVTIAKSNLAIFEPLEAAVTDSHAKDVTGQIVEHFATLTGRLTVDHPFAAPHRAGHLVQEAGAPEGCTEFGAEDPFQRAFRHQEGGVPGRKPLLPIG